MINLLYAATPRYGGWPSFTAHLYAQLRKMGHAVRLFKAGNRLETQQRPYGRGLTYQNIGVDALGAVAGEWLVTAVDKGGVAHAQALAGKALFVVHDPTELKPDFVQVLKASAVVAIRPTFAPALAKHGIESTFIPHPYERFDSRKQKRTTHAVAVSRIDWDKHTDIIAKANALLPKTKRVQIYGAENRMYTHHKIDQLVLGWRDDVRGTFPVEFDAGMRLCEGAHWMVDLSVIAGDGGGSQYTFMEAWDAGAALVVNRGWRAPGGEVDDTNSVAVGNEHELADLLRERPNSALEQAGYAALEQHRAELVVPRYVGLLK
jgi:hypothetical protein